MKFEEHNCWNVLEMKPTKDRKKIRKAYAKMSRRLHPEEGEPAFLALKTAYEEAMELTQKKPAQKTYTKTLEPLPHSLPEDPRERAKFIFETFHTRQEWKHFFLSPTYFTLYLNTDNHAFLNPMLDEMNASISTPATRNYSTYFFIAYQVHSRLPDPLPTKYNEFLQGARFFMALLRPKALSDDDLRFGLAFRNLLLLFQHTSDDRIIPVETALEQALITYRQFPPEEREELEAVLSYFFQEKIQPLPTKDSKALEEIIVNTLGIYNSTPQAEEFAYFYELVHTHNPVLTQNPPDYWDDVIQYIRDFQGVLQSTPKKQQNTLAFVSPFFNHCPKLNYALQNPQFMESNVVEELVNSTKNRLFLVKFLRLLLLNKEFYPHDKLIDQIIHTIWQESPPDLGCWDSLEKEIIKEEEGENEP